MKLNLNEQKNFITNIKTVYGEQGCSWLQHLAEHLMALAKQWNFTFIQPIPNLTFSFVGLVELKTNNQLAIIKTAPEAKRIAAEIHWLQSIKQGTPQVYAYDEQKNALLIEYLHPGTPLRVLVEQGNDEEATRIICKLIKAMQMHQQDKIYHFQHLTELAKDLRYLKGKIKKYTLTKAEALFRDLSLDCAHDFLLHGDLHHDNILKQQETWKVIDPHGYIGDPIAEVGAMIRNPQDYNPQDQPLKRYINTRLQILSEELPFDGQKIKAWTFCITLLSAAWNCQDFGVLAEREIQIVAAIEKTKL